MKIATVSHKLAKKKVIRVMCRCGNTFLAAFRNGRVAKFVYCTRLGCSYRVYTTLTEPRSNECPGCKRVRSNTPCEFCSHE